MPFVLAFALAAACASSKGMTKPTAVSPKPANPAPAPSVQTAPAPADGSRAEPAVDPAAAFMLGLMPLKSTGVDVFRALHPTYDGRG
ncbi:MAG: hypothetical protein DMD62_14625, partial [Gemmatimonadetes bacterium]